jgi:hypothetical protein
VRPLFETFRDAESYYATLAHETTYWTAHGSRLARDFCTQRFGSEGYAIEELVAELGAAFLCADLDLTLEPHEDHAAYIANWLDVLKADHRAIFTAASHAQRATDFINGLQPGSGGSFVIATFPGAPTPSFARSRMVVGCSIKGRPDTSTMSPLVRKCDKMSRFGWGRLTHPKRPGGRKLAVSPFCAEDDMRSTAWWPAEVLVGFEGMPLQIDRGSIIKLGSFAGVTAVAGARDYFTLAEGDAGLSTTVSIEQPLNSAPPT